MFYYYYSLEIIDVYGNKQALGVETINVELGQRNRLVQEEQVLIIGQFTQSDAKWRKVP